MHPVLFRIGAFEIHTYGVLVAAGFVLGLWLAQRRARQEGVDGQRIADLGVLLILSAMLGAKLFYIVFFWDEFLEGWHAAGWASLRAGFVFYGGFIGATLTAILYALRHQLPIWRLADAFAPSLAVGHALGRLGCFFEGCCYGSVCALPWAVPQAGTGNLVHPTQLYEAAGNFAIFAGLSAFYRHRRFPGQVWWFYVFTYAALRFFVEFFRGDYAVHYFGVFTIAQLIALGLLLVAVVGHEVGCQLARRRPQVPAKP